MYRLLFVFLFNFVICLLIAQDRILLRDSTIVHGKIIEVNDFSVKYFKSLSDTVNIFDIPKSQISSLLFENGFTEQLNTIIRKPKPIEYKKKLFLRLYLTDVFTSKISLGLERKLNNKYAIELDGFHKFATDDNYNSIKKWWKTSMRISNGFEIRAGVARHFIVDDVDFSISGSVSFREHHFSNKTIDTYQLNGSEVKGEYIFSQNRKSVGLFLKFNLRPSNKNNSWEFFIMPGLYGSNTKNTYIAFRTNEYPYQWNYDRDKIPHFTSKYVRDGFAVFPYLNFGFDYRIKQPEKGELKMGYRKITQDRDSLKYGRKNVFTYNFFELIDGAFGISYMRLFYKPGLNLNTSVAISNGLRCNFSTGILVENNTNYYLTKKQYDGSIALNYNFSIDQQSFFFLGPQFRYARFDGVCYLQEFTLDKYYALGNLGFLIRSDEGFSFLFTFATGHYKNNYVKNDPIEKIKQNYMVIKDQGINTLNISLQIGYSF